ncbi:MAG: hypothetical protein KatS3mg106_258 [Gemmataceae bacterium]|nr:MAG: hypothetical protein KatS3mg106_258 [Gemmataceae bacterium]
MERMESRYARLESERSGRNRGVREAGAAVWQRGWKRWVILAAIVVWGVCGEGSGRTPVPGAPPPYEDATLYGIYFVDADEGWAVGDEGVIWHSVDGGKSWERQKSGTRASLRGVHFLTPYTGWAVGRREELGVGAVGVILQTRDGGWHWEELGWHQLPPLHGVRFFDERHGVVWGDGSAAFPSGVFITHDGGKSWQGVPETAWPLCRGAAFRPDGTQGLIVGLGGRWGCLEPKSGRVRIGERDTGPSRNWYAAADDGQMPGAGTWYMVGDGGAIRRSQDGGQSWHSLVPDLPKEALAVCDFRACAAFGKHVWVAGRAGRVVLYSPDRGQSWQRQRLEVPLSIHGMYFLTDQIGWLVGEMGVIHGTTDGGKTWKVQRVGGTRAAALSVHARAQQLPLEHVAVWGGGQGYRCAAVVVTRATESSAGIWQQAEEERWRQAWRESGGVALNREWAFPLPLHAQDLTPRQLLAFWDRYQGAPAQDALLRRLVFALRQWQPEVVLADAVDPRGPAGERLILQAIHEAFRRAADPESFPEQWRILGVEPWAARRLYALTLGVDDSVDSSASGSGSVTSPLEATAVHPHVGEAPADMIAEAARHIGRFPWPRRGWTLVAHRRSDVRSGASAGGGADRLTPAVSPSDVWQGIELTAGGAARRPPAAWRASGEITEEQQRLVLVRRRLERLCSPAGPAGVDETSWLAACQRELRQLPEMEAPRWAVLLAERCHHAGEWRKAQALYQWVGEQWPAHPAALAAARWLLRYEVGIETRQQLWPNSGGVPAAASREIPGMTWLHPVSNDRRGVDFTAIDWDERSPLFRLHRHLEQELRWTAWGPLQAEDPAIRLSLLAARRHLGRTDQAVQLARRWLPSIPEKASAWAAIDPAHAALAAEVWLVEPRRFLTPPLPIVTARRTETRPLLDGQLEDTCWQHAEAIPLRSYEADQNISERNWQTVARFSWDDQYLYLAVRCAHPVGHRQEPIRPRPRDADVRGRDRVEILLDLDRDGQTAYRFRIDQRGAPAEDCSGDPRWNPKYYLASQAQEHAWVVEWAIPWKELGLERPPRGGVWALQVLRVIPGQTVLQLAPAPGAEISRTPAALLRFLTD